MLFKIFVVTQPLACKGWNFEKFSTALTITHSLVKLSYLIHCEDFVIGATCICWTRWQRECCHREKKYWIFEPIWNQVCCCGFCCQLTAAVYQFTFFFLLERQVNVDCVTSDGSMPIFSKFCYANYEWPVFSHRKHSSRPSGKNSNSVHVFVVFTD